MSIRTKDVRESSRGMVGCDKSAAFVMFKWIFN